MSDANVLGQRTRKVNIDRGLADKLNAETAAEEMAKASAKKLEQKEKGESKAPEPKDAPATLESKVTSYEMTEDRGGADDTFTQDGWIDYWELPGGREHNGRAMMSAGELYGIAKKLRHDVEHGPKGEAKKAGKAVKKLIKDFKRGKVIFDTRIEYGINKNDPLEARIIHHYKSSDPSLTKKTTCSVPIYDKYCDVSGEDIKSVLSDSKGVIFLRALFDTEDNIEFIMQNLEFITRAKRKNLRVSTPEGNRYKTPERVVSFQYQPLFIFEVFNRGFTINCGFYTGEDGYARGVKLIRDGDEQ